LRHPSTAAPRRLCCPTGSRPNFWSSWSTLGSRRPASSAWSPAGAGSKSPVCGLPRLAGGLSRSFDGPDPQACVREPPIGRIRRILSRTCSCSVDKRKSIIASPEWLEGQSECWTAARQFCPALIAFDATKLMLTLQRRSPIKSVPQRAGIMAIDEIRRMP
jgi:hypothetical protein